MKILCSVSLVLILGAAVSGQDALPASVRVEITTNKKIYSVGEPIQFRALLVNTSSGSPTWISKGFWYSGGGIAGFQVNVIQLSGKKPSKCSIFAADRFDSPGSRTPKQVLEEDFMLLGPREMIGFEDTWSRCAKNYPGKYEITAEYCTCDLNQDRVKDLEVNRSLVLSGTYRSRPVSFEIR